MPEANETGAEAAGHFEDLLTTIHQQDGGALVLASTLIHNLVDRVDDCISAFNSHLPAVVQRARAAGQKVALVEMHAA
ncbi:hypothetical protein LTR53_020286, partial [Teratosphaeriaceae sp. CCFEE 6253]